MQSLLSELRRRNVVRVAIFYAIAGWIVMQVADVMLPALKLPEWTITLVVALLLLGFPIALVLAWAFEITPGGIKRTHEVPRAESITATTGRKLDFVIIGVLALAVVVLLADRFLSHGERTATGTPVTASHPSPTASNAASGAFLAVLPFANLSGAADADPFAAGIHDDLLTSLSKIAALKVMSRTSVLQYRNTTKPIKEIAQELGVSNILEGGVQRAGKQVRINVQLIDANTDQHLWAETYSRELTADNIFAVQSEISSEITDALAVALSPDEKRRLAAVPTHNLDAYDQFQLGQQRLGIATIESWEEAARHFQRAIVLDPGYAQAYASLARAYIEQVYIGSLSREQMIARAEPLVARAIELDPESAPAYAVLGRVRAYQQRYDEADVAFKRALELAPNDSNVHRSYGLVLSTTGRGEEALPHYQAAIELDPKSIEINAEMATTLDRLGRRDEALAAWARAREIKPDDPWGYYGANFTYWAAGRLADAIPFGVESTRLDPNDPELPAALAIEFLELEDLEGAEHWLEQARALQADHVTTHGASINVSLYKRDVASARAEAEQLLAMKPDDRNGARVLSLAVVRDAAIEAGRTAEVRAAYLEYYPELDTADPRLRFQNVGAATDYARLLIASGEQPQANRLLERVLAFVDDQLAKHGRTTDVFFCDVQALALLGRRQEAIARLGTVADAHFYPFWWTWERDPVLAPVRDDPDFARIVARVRGDVAAQREALALIDLPRPGVPLTADRDSRGK